MIECFLSHVKTQGERQHLTNDMTRQPKRACQPPVVGSGIAHKTS